MLAHTPLAHTQECLPYGPCTSSSKQQGLTVPERDIAGHCTISAGVARCVLSRSAVQLLDLFGLPFLPYVARAYARQYDEL